ncbi:MAG: hypothetical protein RJA70_4442 [Pseudomonadota bacterium]|jgi:hypothetical protein
MDERRPTNTRLLISAAALGLLWGVGCKDKPKTEPTTGATAGVVAASSAPEKQEKACCMGLNDCKGQGGCAVPEGNACAGKNECKGKGGCNMHCPKK